MKVAAVKPTNNINLVLQHIHKTLPLVERELGGWRRLASRIPDENLRKQAQDSIKSKAFHCQGGSIFASYPGVDRAQTTKFIVAYQTISDYLDNLVDSMQVQSEAAFERLHLAMEEALDPEGSISDYYAYYPYKDDGGYLISLVQTCREACVQPAYYRVKQHMLELARLYSRLQTYKHLHINERETKLFGWVKQHLSVYPGFLPWEFAAATGSTLGHFSLYAAAFDQGLSDEQVVALKAAYFPWICGLHILLDYLVDQRIDDETGQLNFVSYYKDHYGASERLIEFVRQALSVASGLDHAGFHRVAIGGLLGLYLSDPKTAHPQTKWVANRLLGQGGSGPRLLHLLCSIMRKSGAIS